MTKQSSRSCAGAPERAKKSSSAVSNSGGCPFKPRRGYVDARTDYLFHFHNAVDDDDNDPNSSSSDLPTKSLVASTNIEDPLYFWQLHSIMGPQPVLDLVTDFYNRVFDDTENAWFRDVFEWAAPKGHHINAQVAYWVDAFGGGRWYHGGNYRLTFHHMHNAREIMTAEGARRWMHHMRSALLTVKPKHRIFQDDPRVFPCIVQFLETKMRTYAIDHRWKFDESDFEALKKEQETGVTTTKGEKDSENKENNQLSKDSPEDGTEPNSTWA